MACSNCKTELSRAEMHTYAQVCTVCLLKSLPTAELRRAAESAAVDMDEAKQSFLLIMKELASRD